MFDVKIDEDVDLMDESIDINAISGLLKLYLRELQNPLIPFESYSAFIQAMRMNFLLSFLIHKYRTI